MKKHELLKKLNDLVKEGQDLLAKGDEFSAEDEKRYQEIETETTTLRADLERLNSLDTRRAALQETDSFLNKANPDARPAQSRGEDGPEKKNDTRIEAIVRPGGLKNFKGPDAAKKAYGFGMWFLGAVCGNEAGRKYCRDNGIEIRAHSEGINSDGGFLVPTQWDNEMIDLREMYGVIRRNARIKIMTSDTITIPRRVSGLKAFPVGEGKEGTESKKGWDRIELTARKWMVLTKITSELNEDAVINLGDDLAGEIAYAFAVAEDDAGFNGDGTAAYHRIQGVIPKLRGLHNTVANIAGIVVASGNQWSEITLTDFTRLKGRVPAYVFQKGTPKWFCSMSFYSEVMERIILEAGGNTAAQLVDGAMVFRFMGYPVEVSQTLPLAEDNSQVSCLFGDLRQAMTFGDRRQTTIAMSEHTDFESDEIAIRGIERYDINVHEIGNAHAQASQRKAGSIVALMTAAG